MIRSVSLAVASVLAVAFLAGAGNPPQDKKDPQSTFEPRSGPGVGQKFLEKFVGDWDVIKTFHPRSGDPARSKGECRQSMVHEGRFLKSEFVFEGKGGKTTGTGLIGYDVRAGAFTSVWVDSRQTRMSIRQSREPFNGKEVVLFSGPAKADEKGPPASRTVTHLEDDGRKLVHRQYTAGPDGKERLVMELLMTRKPGAAPPGN
jgi:Protein of unknown function (DUF1579)